MARTHSVLSLKFCEKFGIAPLDECILTVAAQVEPVMWELRKRVQGDQEQPQPWYPKPWMRDPSLGPRAQTEGQSWMHQQRVPAPFCTAVCFSGQLRALNLAPGSRGWPPVFPRPWTGELHFAFPGTNYADMRWRFNLKRLKNMTVAESIHEHLYPALGDYDVFMTVSTREHQNEPAVGDTSICEPLRPQNNKSHFACEVIKETPHKLFPGSLWDTLDQCTHQGLLQQLHGLYRCNVMIRRHMIETGVEYDYIVRTRPEVAFFEPVKPLNLLIDNHQSIKHVNYDLGASCGAAGVENFFTAGHRNVMQAYLDRFLVVQTIENETTWGDQAGLTVRRTGHSWRDESFAVNYMRKIYGVEHQGADVAACPIKCDPDVCCCRDMRCPPPYT